MNTIGLVDKPMEDISEDGLLVKPYVDGLTDYVKNCNTPMAISINGEWGCGKTSIMQLVKKSCDTDPDHYATVWFDTWEYAQFHNEENIAVSFLESILEEIDDSKANLDVPKDVMLKVIRGLAVDFTKAKLGETIGGVLESATEEDLSGSFTKKMKALKETFAKVLYKYGEKGQRLVIFIDNLDRLRPEVAVSLLETFKIFFDEKFCVFLIAIDKGLVFEGIQEKYGDRLSKEQVESFFDKIIQLPFEIPVSSYSMSDKMLSESFGLQGETTGEDKSWYYTAAYTFTKVNPRKIKRLSNLFEINKAIVRAAGIYEEAVSEKESKLIDRLILSVTAIQMNHPEIYAYLVAKTNQSFLNLLIYGDSLFLGEAESRECIKAKLNALLFPGLEEQEEAFWDEMILLRTVMDDIVTDALAYQFTKNILIEDVILKRKSNYLAISDVEGASAKREDGIPVEETSLGRFVDQVAAAGFYRRITNKWGIREILYFKNREDYGNDGDYFFKVTDTNSASPEIRINDKLAKDYASDMTTLMNNLNYRYGQLQEKYGKENYPDYVYKSDMSFHLYDVWQAKDFAQTMGNIPSLLFSE